jgi:hypothetical protein
MAVVIHFTNLGKKIINASFFVGLPLLWLGVVSFDMAPAAPQESNFLPVVIQPHSSADFGVDKFIQIFAPMDMDIIGDAQNDRSLFIPQTGGTLPNEEQLNPGR